MEYTHVIDFWFNELAEADWFSGGAQIDQLITDRFMSVHSAAVAGELWTWRETALGSLAEVIVLDQFSRNLYRGQATAFASDGQALSLAQVAITKGFDVDLTSDQRQFLYMPFMHSESKLVHVEGLRLFTALGDEGNLKYEIIHKDIIDQFGRYPHRNQQLGRESTPEEIDYLSNTQESFFAS